MVNPIFWLILIVPVIATFLGGLFALRNHKYTNTLRLILAFALSAGAVIGVALFDLLPESLELARDTYGLGTIIASIVIGFGIYWALNKLVSTNADPDDNGHYHIHGHIGAGSLVIHSLFDGLGIGLALLARDNLTIALPIAAGVIAHDFWDGFNTVTLVLKNGGSRRDAFKWLLLDAIAPIIGVVVASLIQVSEPALGLIFALFTGFFLFIGVIDLLPETRHHEPKWLTAFSTVLGSVIIYIAVHLAKI